MAAYYQLKDCGSQVSATYPSRCNQLLTDSRAIIDRHSPDVSTHMSTEVSIIVSAKCRWHVSNLLVIRQQSIGRLSTNYRPSKLSGAPWPQGGKRKESLQLHLWNLNIFRRACSRATVTVTGLTVFWVWDYQSREFRLTFTNWTARCEKSHAWIKTFGISSSSG